MQTQRIGKLGKKNKGAMDHGMMHETFTKGGWKFFSGKHESMCYLDDNSRRPKGQITHHTSLSNIDYRSVVVTCK